MVIRRIREHVTTHNWFAVAVDLLIVVLGVFIGTQANNWNEARLERAAGAESLREIMEDLRNNEVDLASRRAYYGDVRTHSIAALRALESDGAPRGEQFLIDAYQASQVWARPLIRAGYDEMTSAGLIRSIGTRETRSRLTTYYAQIRQFDITAISTTPYRERLRQAMPYAVQAAIREHCPERVTFLRSGAQVAALPDRCAVALDRSDIEEAAARLDRAQLAEDLTRHIADLDQKLSGYDRFGRLARELRVHLESIEGR
ncbi:MAG: hypothetical protein ACJ8E4_01265 [Sphingomicrobium sp.]